jgi:DNA modification methylase
MSQLLLSAHSVSSRNVVHHLDALSLLRALPSESVNCIVTSPPYYALRNYQTAGQIGLEDTPAAYIARLVTVFREARRVLRGDGVLWLNMGDSYAAHGAGADGKELAYMGDAIAGRKARLAPPGYKPKDLMMIPARVAIALCEDGWYLRSCAPWVKRSAMPESCQDRPTNALEYVYLLSKSERYWWDPDAIRQKYLDSSIKRIQTGWNGNNKRDWPGTNHNNLDRFMGTEQGILAAERGRSRRNTDWYFEALDAEISALQALRAGGGVRLDADGLPLAFDVNPEPSSLGHFAMFPQALVEPMIRAGCPERVCAACGTPWARDVETVSHYEKRQDHSQPTWKPPMVDSSGWQPTTRKDNGFRPACSCDTVNTRPGLVLDMFMGAGTTGLVAQRLGRDYSGGDLNADYVAIATDRLAYHGDDARMVSEAAAGVRQMPLMEVA